MSEAAPQRLFTFRSGGWVLVLTGVVCLGLMAWALAQALLRASNPQPGDGVNTSSYLFDLTSVRVPVAEILPAMLQRDMVPSLVSPGHHAPEEAQKVNDPRYHKYMVSTDMVVGVTVNGESRAYPIHVLNVHEVINDTLGNPGVPIAVTYSTLCDATKVYDRRTGGNGPGSVGERVAEFWNSGLVYNSNFLMYDKREPTSGGGMAGSTTAPATEPSGTKKPGGESLWMQLSGEAVTGRDAAAGRELIAVPHELMPWGDWLARHPETTVVDRNLQYAMRYKDAAPTPYFRSPKLRFPVSPMPPEDERLTLKVRVVAVESGDTRRVYPMWMVIERAIESAGGSDGPRVWTHQWPDGRTVRFEVLGSGDTIGVSVAMTPEPPSDQPMMVTRSFWFAWHALHPDDAVVR